MRYLLFVILLVVIIITAGCVKSESRNIPNSKITLTPTSTECKYDTCNGICYYQGTQNCCGGRLFNVSDGKCCGGIIHDNTKDPGTCCGGKWIVSGTPGQCCPNPELLTSTPSWQNYEQFWINTSIQHCCAGKVADGGIKTGRYPTAYFSTDEWRDCGDSACYDTSSQSCCLSEVQPKQWTAYDIRTRSETSNSLKVYDGKNRCCTHGYIKLCAEGMTCCYNDSGNSEPICQDSESKICDLFGGYKSTCKRGEVCMNYI